MARASGSLPGSEPTDHDLSGLYVGAEAHDELREGGDPILSRAHMRIPGFRIPAGSSTALTARMTSAPRSPTSYRYASR